MNNTLWYKQEANCFTHALPLGNGRLGAMVYGGVNRERFSMNEDTLWSGYPQQKALETGYEGYKKAQALALEQRFAEASAEIERSILGEYNDSYMPMCDLFIDFNAEGKVSAYSRRLELAKNLSTVQYTIGDMTVVREAFISEPDQVLALRFCADKPNGLNISVGFGCQLQHSISNVSDALVLDGLCPSRVEPNYAQSDEPVRYYTEPERVGVRYRVALRACETDGQVTLTCDTLDVTNASTVTIVLTAFSNFNGFQNPPEINGKEYKDRTISHLNAKSALSYEQLKLNHIADYAPLYNRASVDLCGKDMEGIPTDDRLASFQTVKSDIGMYELLFNYGRFLTIASSRKATQAINLQGIWNEQIRPPWSSNYTVNINTEMNYWPTLVCNLAECYDPLISLVKDISVSGAHTAQTQYHARGFTAHHNVDLWRNTNAVGNHTEGSTVYGFWPLGAGWLCSHVFEYYHFTQDKAYLHETAFPLLKACAQFFLDVLIEYNGELLFCPSTSPENNFLRDGVSNNLSITTTMTTAIIRETFENFLETCAELGISDEECENVRSALSKLTPFRTGAKGQLLEWYFDEQEQEPHHRHISHLYGFHPANLITIRKTPELCEAVKQSLLLRGDDGTGWSLGWKINQWARLKDGNHAITLMNNQLRMVEDRSGTKYSGGGGSYINLFDAHPPFQIDGNFAFTAGLAEMLMQSHDDCIEILPALPDCMPNGKASGLVARGNIVADFEWQNGIVISAVLTAKADATVTVVCNGVECSVELIKDVPVRVI